MDETISYLYTHRFLDALSGYFQQDVTRTKCHYNRRGLMALANVESSPTP